MLAELSDELEAIRRQGRYRLLHSIEAIAGSMIRIGARSFVNWCSNDYLGLAAHPALGEAAAQAAREWGVGGRASRLLTGTSQWHARLEERLAAWFEAEDSIIYSSGYLANLGTLQALCGTKDAVFVDRLAHASLIDAARSTRAAFKIFRHNDSLHVATLLARAPRARRRFIVTEGVFSMEGDRAALSELLAVAESYEAVLYVDDAHGAFVLGAGGRGSPQASGVSHRRLLYMATLGKALGCQGGFVTGSRVLIDLLRNRARTFIYSTAPAIPVVAAAVKALTLLETEPQRRHLLWDRAGRLAEEMQRCSRSRQGIGCSASQHTTLAQQRCRSADAATVQGVSAIIPLIIGSSEAATALSEKLWGQGIYAPAIRPPTVHEGTARLRFSVTSLHTDEQIHALGQALSHALAPTH